MALAEGDPLYLSDFFRMFVYKVEACPRPEPHDWTQCPFAHATEKAKRRDPTLRRIRQTTCPDFRKFGLCQAGDDCPLAHGVFESWLAPSKFRTQMCTTGPNCSRRVCFFAHTPEQLRIPSSEEPAEALALRERLLSDLMHQPEHAYKLEIIYSSNTLLRMRQMVGERLALIQHFLAVFGRSALPSLLACTIQDLRNLVQAAPLPATPQVPLEAQQQPVANDLVAQLHGLSLSPAAPAFQAPAGIVPSMLPQPGSLPYQAGGVLGAPLLGYTGQASEPILPRNTAQAMPHPLGHVPLIPGRGLGAPLDMFTHIPEMHRASLPNLQTAEALATQEQQGRSLSAGAVMNPFNLASMSHSSPAGLTAARLPPLPPAVFDPPEAQCWGWRPRDT